MVPVWELRLFDQNGYRVATLDEWPEFEVEIPVNGYAAYALRLHGDDPVVPLFEPDGLLEGWWCDPENNIDWHREFCAWTEDRRFWRDKDGVRWFESSGRGLEAMLEWQIIDAHEESTASRKSGAGETVIKAYVDEQAAGGAGTRARYGLTVEADAGLGTTWSGQRSNVSLLRVCHEIAETTGLQFGIVRTGRYAFEFRVWQPILREAVLFAESRGNMLEPELVERRSEMANWIKIGGDGTGSDREATYLEDADSIASTPQGRRERFVNAVSNTGDELDARGEQELARNRRYTTFRFVVAQTPGTLYGQDYFLGDYVRALYDGTSYLNRIDKARWQISADGARLDVSAVEAVWDAGS